MNASGQAPPDIGGKEPENVRDLGQENFRGAE